MASALDPMTCLEGEELCEDPAYSASLLLASVIAISAWRFSISCFLIRNSLFSLLILYFKLLRVYSMSSLKLAALKRSLTSYATSVLRVTFNVVHSRDQGQGLVY